jgi:hypothetical protein
MTSSRLLIVLIAAGCVGHPASAGAHRLDEYLQATRLLVDVDCVTLEFDLTPGATIAPQVFASIDTNGNGQIDAAEGAAYAVDMLSSVMLTVDGRPASIMLADSRFPALRDMSLGTGMIRLRATAKISAAAPGRHQISYMNGHRSESSVYLVNALIPVNPRIQVVSQQRDHAQHELRLDFIVTEAAPWAQAWSLFAAVALAGVLAVTRRPRRTRRSDEPAASGR